MKNANKTTKSQQNYGSACEKLAGTLFNHLYGADQVRLETICRKIAACVSPDADSKEVLDYLARFTDETGTQNN